MTKGRMENEAFGVLLSTVRAAELSGLGTVSSQESAVCGDKVQGSFVRCGGLFCHSQRQTGSETGDLQVVPAFRPWRRQRRSETGDLQVFPAFWPSHGAVRSEGRDL